jgi:hypothetical protein
MKTADREGNNCSADPHVTDYISQSSSFTHLRVAVRPAQSGQVLADGLAGKWPEAQRDAAPGSQKKEAALALPQLLPGVCH